MGALLSIMALLTGALAANRLAKWRGLNVGLLTVGGFLFSVIAVPAGFLMRGNPAKATGTKSSALTMVALWIACLFGLLAVAAREVIEDGHREALNRIIVDNYQGATVQADFVFIPLLGLAPLLMSEYSGYFTITNKSGLPPLPDSCDLLTVDFSARNAGDNNILTIKPSETYWPTCGS